MVQAGAAFLLSRPPDPMESRSGGPNRIEQPQARSNRLDVPTGHPAM